LDKVSKDNEIGREREYEVNEKLKKTKDRRFRLVNRTIDAILSFSTNSMLF